MPRGQRSTVRLTKRYIDTLRTEDPRGERTFDSEVPGLSATVYPSGAVIFSVDYGTAGRRRRIALGRFGVDVLSVDDARSEARKVKEQVREGTDPLDVRKLEREASTFKSWADRFVELGKADGKWAPRSLIEVERHLRRASEAFGTKRLGSVTSRDVEVFRNRIHDDHGLVEGNRSLSTVKAALSEAWRRGLVPSNEASKVCAVSGQSPRTRTLSDDELTKLLAAVARHRDQHFKAAMLWLILTGARKSEVLRATWADLRLEDVDQAEWTLPKPKNGTATVRPIPRALAEELKRLPKVGLLAVSTRSGRWFDIQWEKLRAGAGLPDELHLHDLRRSIGLRAVRAGGLRVAQLLLGHANIKTTAAVYTPLGLDDLRGHQDAVVGKVLSFRKVESNGEK